MTPPPALPPAPLLPLPPGISPDERARFIWGRAKATLHVKDDNQDVTYNSNEVYLLFLERGRQEAPGSTQYLLYPLPVLSMTWTATGTVSGCPVEGKATITFPIDWSDPNEARLLDPTRDPTRPAFGYMNVVGPEGGDFHSVVVKAFDPGARLTKTCPGDPPMVTEVAFEAGYLLNILWQKNTDDGSGIRFKGTQTHDEGNRLDFLTRLMPGSDLPDVARQALSQVSTSGTSRQYTWEWEMVRVRPAR